jgi:hypothetical protein
VIFRYFIDIGLSNRGRLAAKKDPRNPWTSENLLQSFIDLNNRQVVFKWAYSPLPGTDMYLRLG